MEKVRVGVIGMGVMGIAHAKVYQALRNVELVCLVETDEKRIAGLKESFSVPVFTSTKDMYTLGVDAVSICTPDSLHTCYMLEAFSHDARVLVEKPLTTSSAECEEVLSKRPSPNHLMVGHLLRYDPRLVSAKKYIDDGRLGDLLLINICRSNSMFNAKRIGSRCSIAWFLGIHDIDAVHWLTGQKVREVVGVNGFKCFNDNWDYTGAHLIMEGGAALTMENHWLIPETHRQQVEAYMKLIGRKGMLEVSTNFVEASFTPMEGDGTRFYDTHYQPDDTKGVPGGDLRRELEAFIDAVLDGTPMPISGEEGMEAVKVIEAIEAKLCEKGYQL